MYIIFCIQCTPFATSACVHVYICACMSKECCSKNMIEKIGQLAGQYVVESLIDGIATLLLSLRESMLSR